VPFPVVTIGPVIPRQVAPQQSLLPCLRRQAFHRTLQIYDSKKRKATEFIYVLIITTPFRKMIIDNTRRQEIKELTQDGREQILKYSRWYLLKNLNNQLT